MASTQLSNIEELLTELMEELQEKADRIKYYQDSCDPYEELTEIINELAVIREVARG